MQVEELKQKLQKHAILWQVGLAAAVLFVAAPLLFTVLKASLALVAIGALAAVVLVAGPTAGRILANWSLKAAIAEATRNPIETMWNNYNRREEQLRAYKDQIVRFGAKVMTLKDELDKYIRTYGRDGADKMATMVYSMQKLLEQRQTEYTAAEAHHKRYRAEIQKAQAMYDLAVSAQGVSDMAGQKIAVLDQIMEETAMRSVEEKVNTSFMQLETSMLQRVEEKPINVIDGQVLARKVEA